MKKDCFRKNCAKILISIQICSLVQAHAVEQSLEEQAILNQAIKENTEETNTITTNKIEAMDSRHAENKAPELLEQAITDKDTNKDNKLDTSNVINDDSPEIPNAIERNEVEEENIKEKENQSKNEKNNMESTIQNNWLNLEVAKLVGKDYTELKKEDYESITRITVRKQNVTGPIPKDIGKMINLEFIDFSENKITGEIPIEIGNLTKLKTLWIADNQLTGSIPDEFYTLTELESVVLRDNNLEGCLKENIRNLKLISNLTIRGNSIGGKLPEGLYELTELKTLDIRDNKFEGIISSKIGNLNKITTLYINGNRFVGEMPSELLEILCNNVSNANNFYISFNQMIGSASDRFIEKFTGKKFNGTMVKEAQVPLKLKAKKNIKIDVDIYNRVDLSEIRKYIYLEMNDNGNITRQSLNDYYNIELIPEEEGFINSEGLIIKSGSVKAKIKIKESTIDNPNTITEEMITLNINPLKITHTLSESNWTNQDVDIKLNFSSDVVKKVILPNSKETSEKDISFRVDGNGEYKFIIVDLYNKKYEYIVKITNIHKEKPAIENKEEVVEVKEDVITIDISNIITSVGLFKIILPDGEEILSPTENTISFTVPRNGIYRIIVIDKAGNELHLEVPVETIKEDIDKDESTLPETGGLARFSLALSSMLFVLGLFLMANNKRDKE